MATEAALVAAAEAAMRQTTVSTAKFFANVQAGKYTPEQLKASAHYRAHDLLYQATHLPASPAPPPPPPSRFPTVPSKSRGHNGLYFYNLFDIDAAIAYAKKYNLWIGILVNETNLTPMQNGARRDKAAIFAERDKIKNAGVTCLATGWADPNADLASQAAVIGEMAQGFDEYMLNIEAAWVWEAGVDAFLKSQAFAPMVRGALGPNMPLSICCDWGNNIDWLPWLNVGMSAVRVQCYMNEWPHKNPKDGMALLGRDQGDPKVPSSWLPGGVPVEMREVVYGRYSDGPKNAPLTTWVPQDDAAGKPPRSVWSAEHSMNDPDCAFLAR